jgi:hypothetical protein
VSGIIQSAKAGEGFTLEGESLASSNSWRPVLSVVRVRRITASHPVKIVANMATVHGCGKVFIKPYEALQFVSPCCDLALLVDLPARILDAVPYRLVVNIPARCICRWCDGCFIFLSTRPQEFKNACKQQGTTAHRTHRLATRGRIGRE